MSPETCPHDSSALLNIADTLLRGLSFFYSNMDERATVMTNMGRQDVQSVASPVRSTLHSNLSVRSCILDSIYLISEVVDLGLVLIHGDL
jgi:hypothetical protein